MLPKALFTNETQATATSEVAVLRSPNGQDDAVVQVDISDEATVVIHGRVSPRLEWRAIKTLTASDIIPVARLGEIKLSLSGNTGTVNADVLS